MQLPEKLEIFSPFFNTFLEKSLNIEKFEKNDEPHLPKYS